MPAWFIYFAVLFSSLILLSLLRATMIIYSHSDCTDCTVTYYIMQARDICVLFVCNQFLGPSYHPLHLSNCLLNQSRILFFIGSNFAEYSQISHIIGRATSMEYLLRYGDLSMFQNGRRPPSWFVEIQTFNCWYGSRATVHHCAEFCADQSNRCLYVAIFRFFKMVFVRHFGFSKLRNFKCQYDSEGQLVCFIVPNFAPIG